MLPWCILTLSCLWNVCYGIDSTSKNWQLCTQIKSCLKNVPKTLETHQRWHMMCDPADFFGLFFNYLDVWAKNWLIPFPFCQTEEGIQTNNIANTCTCHFLSTPRPAGKLEIFCTQSEHSLYCSLSQTTVKKNHMSVILSGFLAVNDTAMIKMEEPLLVFFFFLFSSASSTVQKNNQ